MNKKSNKLKFVLITLALFGVGLIILSNSNTEQAIMETTMGRIDLSTKPYTEESKFFIYNEYSEGLKEASWMKKYNSRGYTLQKEGISTSFNIKANDDISLNLELRGKWEQDEDKNMIENWVDFTSVTINGEEILPGTVAVWHNKPFKYVIHAKAGETYKVEAKWQKHEDTKVSE